MASEGLFQSQEQNEHDLLNGPGWTIDQQKPGTWEGSLSAPVSGVRQGGANVAGALASGLNFRVPQPQAEAVAAGPAAASQAISGKQELEPWKVDWNAKMQEGEANARKAAKSFVPDPRTTGSAANLIDGFSRVLTEAGIGSLVGGPEVGAVVAGTSEGYSRYFDLKDQGVDDDTAWKSAQITGIATGAGALMGMKLPGAWLEKATPAATYLMQGAAGAASNAALGAASRESDSAILRKAGYPEMADQSDPWDKASLLTDLLTGSVFGLVGAHGDLAHKAAVAVQAEDAARVIMDHRAVTNQAPGVPVDLKSQAIHRQALEKALGDVMANRPVDVGDMEGATFARPAQDTTDITKVIREEFDKHGVVDAAGEFDEWMKDADAFLKQKAPKEPTLENATGEVITPENLTARREDAQARLDTAPEEMNPEERAKAVAAEKDRLQTPESVKARLQEKYGDEFDKVVGDRAEATVAAGEEQRTTAEADLKKVEEDQEQLNRTADPAAAAIAARPELELPTENGTLKASDALDQAKEASSQVNKEADTTFSTLVNCELRHA